MAKSCVSCSDKFDFKRLSTTTPKKKKKNEEEKVKGRGKTLRHTKGKLSPFWWRALERGNVAKVAVRKWRGTRCFFYFPFYFLAADCQRLGRQSGCGADGEWQTTGRPLHLHCKLDYWLSEAGFGKVLTASPLALPSEPLTSPHLPPTPLRDNLPPSFPNPPKQPTSPTPPHPANTPLPHSPADFPFLDIAT